MSNLSPQEVLKKYWSFEDFRDPQEEVVKALISKKEVIALLPTGAGKSICFQVPGVMLPGLTLVISPLVALMEDQVGSLESKGIKAMFLHSAMHKSDIDRSLDNAIYGNYKFLYLSPERIHSEFFLARVEKMSISQIIIDEAHCISQWGHDFRPSYQQVNILRELFPSVPISAFTATATKKTLQDMQNVLGSKNAKVFRKSFVKENLSYTVVKSTNKLRELLYLLARLKGAGIVYLRSRKEAERIALKLGKEGYSADFYHAGLTYKARKSKQEKWISEEDAIMVSTNAFGMGIDKSDVRWVVHFDIPSSLEEYYQEAGRAGRDGMPSHAILIYDDKDVENSFKKLELTQLNSTIVNDVYDKLFRFLGIAIGEGINESFIFDINLFARKYKIAIKTIETVIKLLEESAMLTTSESIYSPSTLILNSASEDSFRENQGTSPFKKFLLSLVRNYEGLFTNYVKISEEKIARITNLKLSQVESYLINIQELGLGKYAKRTDLPRIIFLADRVEARSLTIDYQKLDNLYQWKWSKLESMIEFVQGDQCREVAILKYFSENKNVPCQRCDICKGSARNKFTPAELIELLEYLKDKNTIGVEMFDLLHWWPLNKRKKVLAMLGILENENKIKISNKKLTIL